MKSLKKKKFKEKRKVAPPSLIILFFNLLGFSCTSDALDETEALDEPEALEVPFSFSSLAGTDEDTTSSGFCQ